jgi:two-component system sensor histidine kinase FlrB
MMQVADTDSKHRQLEHAFEAFGQLSAQLERAYRELEDRVGELTRELERSRRERAAQARERLRLARRLEGLLDALPAGVVRLDGEGIVVDANPAARAMIGQEALGRPWSDVAACVFTGEADVAGDLLTTGARRLALQTRRLPEGDGQLLLLTDVTETRALQDLVARQQRLSSMGEMAASLAHQIRTPLAAALLYVSQLEHLPAHDPQAVSRIARRSAERLRHLEGLVHDMLVYARGGAGPEEAIDVADLFESVRRASDHLRPPGGVLEAAVTPNLTVTGARDALCSALVNLVANAFECGGPGTQVMLSADRDGGRVALWVEDDGPGLPPDVAAQAFRPFFTTRRGGTGLGLAVVKTVAEAHGGRALVDGSKRGGARIGLELPSSTRRAGRPLAAGGRKTGIRGEA